MGVAVEQNAHSVVIQRNSEGRHCFIPAVDQEGLAWAKWGWEVLRIALEVAGIGTKVERWIIGIVWTFHGICVIQAICAPGRQSASF